MIHKKHLGQTYNKPAKLNEGNISLTYMKHDSAYLEDAQLLLVGEEK